MDRQGTASRTPLLSIPPPMVGRCELFDEIASGGMATIHLGRMRGAGGFARTVAVKRMHEQCSRDPEFVAMFLDEARIVARIRHPNVAATLDLVEEGGVLSIIMEYIEGISFAELLKAAEKKGELAPAAVAIRIVTEALHGLHAAHEATDETGHPMGIVHRDVSPENIMVGTDGYPRVLDFGIARAAGRLSSTRDGSVKGKIAYMAPEQILGTPLDRRTDVFAASAILWQALTGRRLWQAENFVELAHKVLNARIDPPSKISPSAPKKYDSIVMRGLEREVDKRWRTAGAMAEALEAVGGMATHREVGLWVRQLGADKLRELMAKVSKVENKRTSRHPEAKRGRPAKADPKGAAALARPASPTDTGVNKVKRERPPPPPPVRSPRKSDTFEVGPAPSGEKPAEDEPAGTLAVVSAEPDSASAPVDASGEAVSVARQRRRRLLIGAGAAAAVVSAVAVVIATTSGGGSGEPGASTAAAASSVAIEPSAEPSAPSAATTSAVATAVVATASATESTAASTTAPIPSAATTPKSSAKPWQPPTKPSGKPKDNKSLYQME